MFCNAMWCSVMLSLLNMAFDAMLPYRDCHIHTPMMMTKV